MEKYDPTAHNFDYNFWALAAFCWQVFFGQCWRPKRFPNVYICSRRHLGISSFLTPCSWTVAKTRVVDNGLVGYGSFWFVAWKHLVQSVGYQGCNSIDPNICSESWFWGWEGNFHFTRIMSLIITFYVYLVRFDLNLSITVRQLVLVLRSMKRNLQKYKRQSNIRLFG